MTFTKFFHSILFVFFFISILTGCEDNIVNVSQPSEEAITLTAQGWTAFEQRDYARALSSFRFATEKNPLYTDAFNGLAWSYARLDSLQKAIQYFDVALGINFNLIDAYAGRAFVSLALGKYEDALTAVQKVQNVDVPFYVFRHDANISINDLLLVKAQSYFLLRNYPAAQMLIDQLDPSNSLDAGSVSYVEDLALEIEQLWSTI